ARLKIGFQVTDSGHVRFDRDEPFEAIRERHAEKTDAGKQIERQPPSCFPDHCAHEFIQQKTIHLKKREMADPVVIIPNAIADVARPGELKAISAAIMN